MCRERAERLINSYKAIKIRNPGTFLYKIKHNRQKSEVIGRKYRHGATETDRLYAVLWCRLHRWRLNVTKVVYGKTVSALANLQSQHIIIQCISIQCLIAYSLIRKITAIQIIIIIIIIIMFIVIFYEYFCFLFFSFHLFTMLCTCIYCVLYCLYCVFVLFRLCILFILSVLV